MRRIAIATGTRADWGLLSPIARALNARRDVEVQIIATNMHLIERYGHTISEIEADGLRVAASVPMDSDDDSAAGKVRAMAACMAGMADALGRLHPDLLVILGDRYEMLATASAALMMGIPIAHIAGGEISEGAVDDSIRHAITKMASLHLAATESYRRRIIQMGEQPRRVINTGAIGVWNALNQPMMSLDELRQSLGFEVDGSTLMVTYHPVTLDTAADPADRFSMLLEALDRFPDNRVIITYPNNDARGTEIIRLIDRYAACSRGRVLAVPSLGRVRYLSALQYVAAAVGNSSSGIVEVPSMHIPTVDIGMRQRGRLASRSVIHCGDSADQIAAAIAFALSPDGRRRAAEARNPYEGPDALSAIVDALVSTPVDDLTIKKFYNIEMPSEL